MKKITYRQMVKAMQISDTSFDGRFYTGVHSTGIYCLPSCKAKLPLLKNVTFYQTREEAIAAGLRGCKRCKSGNFPNILPDWLILMLRQLDANRTERLNEKVLEMWAGVDISTVRRYFKTHLNCTPLAFHRRVRLNHAHRLIESGENYLTAAYDSGFESSSGFRDAFLKEFGVPPGSINAE